MIYHNSRTEQQLMTLRRILVNELPDDKEQKAAAITAERSMTIGKKKPKKAGTEDPSGRRRESNS